MCFTKKLAGSAAYESKLILTNMPPILGIGSAIFRVMEKLFIMVDPELTEIAS
jgi:hypothetical protein